MFMFNIILAFCGVAFFVFGFLVCFKKKYNLVIGASKAEDAETYAEQMGLISLMSGMLYIFAGIVGFISASLVLSFIMLSACILLTTSLSIVSSVKARRA